MAGLAGIPLAFGGLQVGPQRLMARAGPTGLRLQRLDFFLTFHNTKLAPTCQPAYQPTTQRLLRRPTATTETRRSCNTEAARTWDRNFSCESSFPVEHVASIAMPRLPARAWPPLCLNPACFAAIDSDPCCSQRRFPL